MTKLEFVATNTYLKMEFEFCHKKSKRNFFGIGHSFVMKLFGNEGSVTKCFGAYIFSLALNLLATKS